MKPITGAVVVEAMDGRLYAADTHAEIVEQMRDSSWGGEQSAGIRGYMRQVAKRVWDWSQRRIRVDTAQHFLQDMQAHGLIQMRSGK